MNLNVLRNFSQIEIGCAPMSVQLAEVLYAYDGNAADYRDNLWFVFSSSFVSSPVLL